MPPRDFSARKGEIAKAGGLFFDAIFGEAGTFEKRLRDELAAEESARTAPERRDLAPVSADALPPSSIRCDACGREQSVPAHVDAHALERIGWRRVERRWHCSFCAE